MADDWYCQVDQVVLGPLPPNVLKRMAKTGKLKPNDLVKKTEAGRWSPARSIKGLSFEVALAAIAQPLAESPEPQGNLGTGSKVPRTGTYKCHYCGPEGMGAVLLKRTLKIAGLPYSPPPSARAQPPYKFFKEGDTFPSCPNCKNESSGADPTGWSFWSKDEHQPPPLKAESKSTETKNIASVTSTAIESLWYAWSFMPGCCGFSWIHAGIRAKRPSYFLFAILYFVVSGLIVGIGTELEKQTDNVLAGVAFFAIMILNFLIYVGGIVHTQRARKEVARRINDVVSARTKKLPLVTKKCTSTQADSLEDFARKACKAKTTNTMRLDEVSRFIPLLLDCVRTARPVLASSNVSEVVMAGLVVHCPKCGQFSKEAVAVMAMAGTDAMKGALFTGAKVAQLGRGRCPGCGGTTAQVTYDPKLIASGKHST